MRSTVLQLEFVTASLLPVAAVLLIGAQSLQGMERSNTGGFVGLLFACAVGVFMGELVLIHLMQRATKAQFHEVVLGCQEFIAGNREKRLTVHGDNALTTLTRVLNTLFDVVAYEKAPVKRSQSVQAEPPAQTGSEKQLQHLDGQLQHLIREIAPVRRGDLRVRASQAAGNVGIVADICNALIEEVIELVQWTRYSAEQVISGTGSLLSSSIELAEVIETQMARFSQTTEGVEKLVAFLQRLNNSLQLNVEMIQGIRDSLQKVAQASSQEESLFERLEIDTRRQAQLLEQILNSTQSNITIAESMISDFYTFAQRIHQSSIAILQTAETINALAKVAEQWRNGVLTFQLPGQALQQLAQATKAVSGTTKHHASSGVTRTMNE